MKKTAQDDLHGLFQENTTCVYVYVCVSLCSLGHSVFSDSDLTVPSADLT